MSDQTLQFGTNWINRGQQSLLISSTLISTTSKNSANSALTLTYTDYVTSTIIPTSPGIVFTHSSIAPIPTLSQSESIPKPSIGSDQYQPTITTEEQWEHRIHRVFPVILAFAIIGILTVIGSLIYLAFRFYQANKSSRKRRRNEAEDINFQDEENKQSGSPASATLSSVIPWLSIPSPLHPADRDENYINNQPLQREPIRYEKSDLNRIMLEDNSNPSTRRPSLAPSWLFKILPRKFSSQPPRFDPPPRHMSMPILGGRTIIDNLNVPISSTFKPIDKSSLTLVPRSEIWLDPNRRRGVDELDMWERKKSGATVTVPDEQIIQPTPLMWRFPSQNAYPDSPESFERRFSTVDRRRSIHIDSRHSSTTTMQEVLPPLRKKSNVSRSKSESTRYNMEDDDDNQNEENSRITDATNSVSYPDVLKYYQEGSSSTNDAYNSSKYAITIKIPKAHQQQQRHDEPESSTSDVKMARNALEASRFKNSSSQWLHSSSSRSF